MNSYNIYSKSESSTILFHSVATDCAQVIQLAKDSEIDLDGLVIEIERSNVKDELGRSFIPSIKPAFV